MKNTYLNLNALENADESTVERMAESYTALDSSDKERIFKISRRIYLDKSADETAKASDVSGVEIYRKPVWHNILAIASALLLFVGIGAGGALLLNKLGKSDAPPVSQPESSDTAAENGAPFGDIANDRIRFMTAAVAPYLIDISEEAQKQLAESFNNAVWTEIDADTPIPDGESVSMYVYNNNEPYVLVFYGDYTVGFDNGSETRKYQIPTEVYAAVHSAVSIDDIYNHLTWYEPSDNHIVDVWKAVENAEEAPYEIPHEVNALNVEADKITDLLTLNHTMRNYVYLEKKDIDESEAGADYFAGLEAVADKQKLDIPVDGKIASMESLRDKVIVEIHPENSDNLAQLGLFDPYAGSYEIIGEIPFTTGYGDYSFAMADRYYVMISTVKENDGVRGIVTVYDIETGTLETADEFTDEYNEFNYVNGITPVGENGIAYFYTESVSGDRIVRYYNLDTKESSEIFRHTSGNNNNSASVKAIGNDGDEIVLVIQYIENGVYRTNLEWITSSGDWYKTEKVNFDELFGNEYEINGITVSGDYYFTDAFIIPQNEQISSILKRSDDVLNIYSFNTLEAVEPLSNSFNELTDIVYTNYSYSYDSGFAVDNGIDGIFTVNLEDTSMRSFDFSEDLSLEDKVLINNRGDLLIFYCNNGKMTEYQLIEDYNSIDVKPQDGGIPVYPGDLDLSISAHEELAGYYEQRDFYYDND